MKVSFNRSWTLTANKIFSRLREHEHEDSTDLCNPKTMKRWIPFVFWFHCQNSASRRFLMAVGFDRKLHPAFFICWCDQWSYLLVQVYELITCVRWANENAKSLIFLVQFLKILTIIPQALMGSESIAHEAEGGMGYWLRHQEARRREE